MPRKIASLHQSGDKYIARILFEYKTIPVYYYFNSVFVLQVQRKLIGDFDNIEIISSRIFQLELDHIKLFGERAADRLDLEEELKASNKEVINFLDNAYMPLSED